METPWTKAVKKRHQKQEERLGKIGKPQINSGRTTWRSKRDVSLFDLFLVEARDTQADKISISRSEWKSLRREASQSPPGLLPAMQLNIQNDVRILAIDFDDAEEFFMEFQNLQERVKQFEYREASTDDDSLPEMFEAFQTDSESDDGGES